MKGYLFIFAAVTAWALEYVLIKKAVNVINPFLAGTVIFIFVTLLLTPFILFRRNEIQSMKKAWKNILWVGIIGALCNIFWLYGTKYTSVANVSILGRTDVLFTFIFSYFVFHEKIRRIALLCVPLMLAGIFLTSSVDLRNMDIGTAGDCMIIVSAFFLSVNAYSIKKAMKDVSGIAVAFANTLINSIIFSLLALFQKDACELIPAGNIVPFLSLVFCGLFSFVFFVSYYASLKRLPVWEVRLLCLGLPVLTFIASWIFGEGFPSGVQILGSALILLGAMGIILSNSGAKVGMGHLKRIKYIFANPRKWYLHGCPISR
ncbi:MAG: hypothetical protein A2017_21935 [Lentisphaerae bacterium GWF2_44_16]|nr:MAG: hypothetical protein A2017_21935 [Lentisphaerae bacterium GWF2_44_16]